MARHRHVAEDVASETVLRVWQRLGDGATWKDLWSLGVRIARNLLLNCLRALRLRRELAEPVDVEVLAGKERRMMEPLDLQRLLSQLRLRLQAAERQTLALLEAGILTVADLAIARGVTERAARKSLARLHAAAGDLWKYC
jgi:DNA-directed RNA polymerase specialized sigma24 family protein